MRNIILFENTLYYAFYSWIDNLLGEIQQIVTTRINRAMDSDEEKERVQQSVYRRLNTLSTEAEQVRLIKCCKTKQLRVCDSENTPYPTSCK